jgi:maltose/moltooligosaccharide transporter
MKRALLAKSLLVGTGLFGIAVIWPIFNTFVPLFLAELGLSASLVGFIMTWDNYLNMFAQPLVGALSDRTRSRIGRRKPWMLVGAPLAAIFFVAIPLSHTPAGIILAILLTNISLALFRSPTSALLGDLFPPAQRSTANGVLNLMGGLGAVVAFLAGGLLYPLDRLSPFVFGSLLLVACILLVLLWLREPEAPREAEKKTADVVLIANPFKILRAGGTSGLLILLAVFGWYLGFGTLETWISSFGVFSLGIESHRMSLITSSFVLSFVVFSVPAGLLGTRWGRKPTILAGIVILTASFAFGWLVQGEVMLIGLLVLGGTAWALINVNALPMLYDWGGLAHVGAFTGLYYLAVNFASVTGPQVVGFLIDLSGKNYRVMFLFAAFCVALAGLLMVRVRETR